MNLGLQFRSLGTGLVLSHFQSDHFFSRPLLVDRDLGLVGLRPVVLVVHDDDLGLGGRGGKQGLEAQAFPGGEFGEDELDLVGDGEPVIDDVPEIVCFLEAFEDEDEESDDDDGGDDPKPKRERSRRSK